MAETPNDTYAPPQQNADASKAILILTADKTEDLEFFYPYYRFIEAGFKVDVATPHGGELKGKAGIGIKNTKKISDIANASNYQLIFIPGGKAPEKLKDTKEAVALVQQFAASGKPIAAICHGPQLLAKADIVRGRRIAAWPDVKEELEEAGAQFVNEESVQDGQFITGRWPADLPAFTKRVLAALQQGVREARAA